jgi:tripartite-type tricarboxylate transporter receptor subunit TctC
MTQISGLTRTAALSAALLATLCQAALADEWPAKAVTVTVIVPFAAGATPDLVARLITDHWRQQFNQTFIVDNRPGASGDIGTEAIARSPADGSVIGISIAGPLALNPLLFAKLRYDPNKDLTMISMLATQPSVLAVNANLGVDSVPELLDLLRRYPGKYNFGSIGTGSVSHLAMEAVALKSGTQIVHIPYASSPQAMTALIRNDVQIACLPATTVMPQADAGSIRILAVTTARRSALLPDVPTLKESGIDVEADAWMGLIGPAGLSDSLRDRIGRLAADAITAPDNRAKLAAQMMEPIPGTPAAFHARLDADVARWKPVIETAGIRIK